MPNLPQEYVTASRPTPGVLSLAKGQQYYEACLRWYLGQHVTAAEVFDLGIREVNRIEGLIKQVSEWWCCTSLWTRLNMFLHEKSHRKKMTQPFGHPVPFPIQFSRHYLQCHLLNQHTKMQIRKLQAGYAWWKRIGRNMMASFKVEVMGQTWCL